MLGGCCVCSDERGWPENPLVYCDGQACTVAVHQACYGIVQVPTGPWYCRKCESQERSARVRCELCPSRDGALKKTDNQGWAHVVCALYIPEVRFGNVTTMEPIILQLIPQERYSKTCYICQEMGKPSRANAGACMQCNKSGCKQQFHVTCAQQLGLLCEEAGNYLDNVKYCGYCQHHYSKLKKGGNVKTIPPYKPITHEANSSDNPSSPEKEGESSTNTTSNSLLSQSTSSSSSNNKMRPVDPLATTSSLPASKPRKSGGPSGSGANSGTSKSNSISSSTSNQSATNVQTPGGGAYISNQNISSSIITSNNSAAASAMAESTKNNNSSSSSSSSGSAKDKDKHSKNSSKISSSTKSHDKTKSSKSSNAGPLGQPQLSAAMVKDPKMESKSGIASSTSVSMASSTVPSRTATMGGASAMLLKDNLASGASPNHVTASSISSSSNLSTKDGLGQKFTTSNFTESIVVNSESVFVHAKKRKADSRTISTSEDYTRDIIKDVTVTLVPLALDKIEAAEGNKKAKTELKQTATTTAGLEASKVNAKSSFIQGQQSPHGDKSQPQVITQVHSTPLIKAATLKAGGIGGDQQHSLLQQQMQQQQQLQQQQQPSLVVSVPLSTANVPGVNLPSNTSATIVVSPHQTNNNNNNSSNNNNNSSSTLQQPQTSNSSSLYQQLTQRNPEQLFHSNFQQNPQLNRSSPIIHLQSQQSQNHQNLIVQPHNQQQQHIVERQSPLIQSSSASGVLNSGMLGNSTAPDSHHGQQQQAQHLNSILPSNISVVQRSSAASPTISASSHGLNSEASGGGGGSGILKITYEKQTTNSRITALQDEGPGRRSRSQSGDGVAANHGPKVRGAKKRALLGGAGGGPQLSPSMSINNPSPAESMIGQANVEGNLRGSGVGGHNNNTSTIISRNDYGVITNNNNNNINTSGSTNNNNNNNSSGGNSNINNNNGSTSKSIFEAAAAAGGMESLSSYIGGGSTATALVANNSISQNNGINVSNNYKKKFRSSSNETPPPPSSMAISSRHTPDTMHSTAAVTTGGSGSFGGLKFSFESQTTVTSASGAPMTTQVKDSPPSSPGSDEAGHSVSAKKRARKSSCSTSNTSSSLSTVTATEVKDAKLFQNGVSGHVQHMLGNQINPSSNVAHKLTDQLNLEMEAHSVYNSSSLDSAQSLVGPLFPGKNAGQSLRTPAVSQGPSLSAMLGGTATATAGGNTPQSLEQLLERQWEQGSQFLMEQAQHFDIASLLSCLHQLRTENVRLEEHVNNLVARRDHLLAVNARLAIPLNPPAAGHGSQGVPFNNMHINGPTELVVSTTTSATSTPSSNRGSNRNSSQQQSQTTPQSLSHQPQQHAPQQHTSQQHTSQQHAPQQQQQPHYGGGVMPMENGIDFRHSTSHLSSGSSSADRSRQSFSSSSTSMNRPNTSSDSRGGGNIGSRNMSNYQQPPSNYSSSTVVHQTMQQQQQQQQHDLGHHLKPR